MLFFPREAFFALWRTETILCLSVFFMLISEDVQFYACQAFYAYQQTSGSISCLSLWKKIKIDLSRNDPFFESGLSGLIFLSRQKNKRSLLDLSVLNNYYPSNTTSNLKHTSLFHQ